ncbi:MAG TPA: hypothetical protein VEY67_05255 [Candidatus Dormibacteraeota bacterium]|nr:hypothetical protein [Candidatus Dormibacteraeota bacterium]
MTSSARQRPKLAWALGFVATAACLAAGGVVLMFGAPTSFLLIDLVGVVLALLGAAVVSRQPSNSVGWLMWLTSLGASLVHLPAGYAYAALVGRGGAWPFGGGAAWFGAWSWVPVLALLPLIAVRFPDGRAPRRWRLVEWLAVGGTALFALGIALVPPAELAGFLPIPAPAVALLAPKIASPFGASFAPGALAAVQGSGLTLIVLAYAGAAASVLARFRRAQGDERLQLKWFAYAGALVAATFVYGAMAWNIFGQPLYLALTPLELATLTVPLAIAIAIFRYRLYDIDLIINRSVVYVSLTAILAALYSSGVTLIQRLFISASGATSDAAYVLTAFVVVVAFSPLKDWLQRQVDRRLPRTSPLAVMEQFRSDVDAVVLALDVGQLARRLVERAAAAFNARGAAVYLSPALGEPFFRQGDAPDEAAVVVDLRHESQSVGLLVMGARRGSIEYTSRDRDALQRSADVVAEALVLAARRAPLATRTFARGGSPMAAELVGGALAGPPEAPSSAISQ